MLCQQLFKHRYSSNLKTHILCYLPVGLPWWCSGKESACQCRRPGSEDPLEKKIATHSNTLAWEGQRSLEGYSPRGRKESDRTQQLNKNSNLPVSTEMPYLLLFKCDVMCIDDLILSPMASREARRDPGTAGRDQEMDGGPDFWIQDVDLEPEDRKELMQSIRILWVALCFHKEHSLAQQNNTVKMTKLFMWP